MLLVLYGIGFHLNIFLLIDVRKLLLSILLIVISWISIAPVVFNRLWLAPTPNLTYPRSHGSTHCHYLRVMKAFPWHSIITWRALLDIHLLLISIGLRSFNKCSTNWLTISYTFFTLCIIVLIISIIVAIMIWIALSFLDSWCTLSCLSFALGDVSSNNLASLLFLLLLEITSSALIFVQKERILEC